MALFNPSRFNEAQRQRMLDMLRSTAEMHGNLWTAGTYGDTADTFGDIAIWSSSKSVDLSKQFELLKKSVRKIEAVPFDGKVRERIERKISRLQRAGATQQSLILQAELRTRDSLVRLKEWDYKLLPYAEILRFAKEHAMTVTTDGLRVHIDPLDMYVGNPEVGEARDRIIPDGVLDKLEQAKERELFDSFAVLWSEKVKDPLLLGQVDGCEDFFLIAEWGSDITFRQIMDGH